MIKIRPHQRRTRAARLLVLALALALLPLSTPGPVLAGERGTARPASKAKHGSRARPARKPARTGRTARPHRRRAAKAKRHGKSKRVRTKRVSRELTHARGKRAHRRGRTRGRVVRKRTRSRRRVTRADVARLRGDIRRRWGSLSRDVSKISAAAADRITGQDGGDITLYISQTEDIAAVRARLRASLERRDYRRVKVRRLPPRLDDVDPQALLYLPNAYVVPGGRFNEMFGWDSYFMNRGLLSDDMVGAARAIADNQLYQVRHYGKVLNANRGWSLSRSQPPLLSRMVLDVYDRTGDQDWVADSYESLVEFHDFWEKGSHRTKTGLSRYYDIGDGPAPEVSGAGDEYERAKSYFRAMGEDASAYYDADTDSLTPHFYRGERAMRESGFDTTNRFGPLGGDTHDYNPVDLNSLLYRMEVDLAKVARIAGKPRAARQWKARASKRRARINRYLWDDARGMYFDYHVPSGKRSRVVFASTFFPLWAGVATPKQARRIVDNLHRLEAPGGILASDSATGHQWDGPFVWAPLVHIAVGGLRNYGYHQQANRIAVNFLSMVLDQYVEHGELMEKYDGTLRNSDVQGKISFGYTTNETGFGWTNGVFADLYDSLSPRDQARVVERAGRPAPRPRGWPARPAAEAGHSRD